MRSEPAVLLVKWGGSLITDKTATEAVQDDVLRRLAAELGSVIESSGGRVILGHGSGSFGHAAAADGGWPAGGEAPSLETLSKTQDAAARLHRVVIAALLEAGMAPFSVAPGSFATAHGDGLAWFYSEPIERALSAGLLPVTFGDVILDAVGGARVLSTERAFLSIAPSLMARGYRLAGAYWLGVTDGILDSRGRTIPEIALDGSQSVAAGLLETGAGAGVRDVTGGMKHRLDSALELARIGVPSWILDGRSEGALERALDRQPGGTRIFPGRSRRKHGS